MPTFHNTPNKEIEVNGEIHWLSRAVAVVGIFVFKLPDNSLWIPCGIRSSMTPDFQGKLSLVCGYLDWNETAFEAICREAWEEIGLDLSRYFDIGADYQPSSIQSDPAKDARQNVTIRFRYLIKIERLPDIKANSNETDSALWIEEALGDAFAFNHKELISLAFSDARLIEESLSLCNPIKF